MPIILYFNNKGLIVYFHNKLIFSEKDDCTSSNDYYITKIGVNSKEMV